jgi:hypothetical protein
MQAREGAAPGRFNNTIGLTYTESQLVLQHATDFERSIHPAPPQLDTDNRELLVAAQNDEESFV